MLQKGLSKVIRDQLYLNEMPTVELSVRLGLNVNQTNQLINGQLEVTPAIASGLERVFHAPASYWMSFNQHEASLYI